MSPVPNAHPDDSVDTRPFLFIPYWTTPMFPGDPGDTGTIRPLPGGVISWLCDGIHASPYWPGQPLDVRVDVGNFGAGNSTSLVTVLVYWSEPIAGAFSKPTLFGATSVAVPPRGAIVPSSVMSGIIPAGSPHICLFALVTHNLDKPGPTVNPIGDRHWAQHNLQAVTVSPKKIVRLSFAVATPQFERGGFEVQIRALDERKMETLAERLKATPRLRLESLRIQLLDDTGKRLTELSSMVTLPTNLGPRGRRGLHLTLQMDERLEEHEFAAIEVVLNHSSERKELVGSLGVLIRPELKR